MSGAARAALFSLALFASPARADIAEASARFLGAPYALDPLGEGFGRDPDPLIRFDRFDCLSFIETILALELGEDIARIRYRDGRVGFAQRNHFLSADWIPNNARLVRDITRDLGVPFAYLRAAIDRKNWFFKVHKLVVRARPAEVEAYYIVKLDLAQYREKLIASLGAPLLVAFVSARDDLREKIGTYFIYSHIGLLVPGEGRLTLRHASSRAGRVVDVDFFEYVEGRRDVRGVGFFEIQNL